MALNFNKIKRSVKQTVRRKSIGEKKLDLMAQFSVMETQLDSKIALEMITMRQNEASNLRDPENEARIKNAYYTRLLITNAKKDLRNLTLDSELNVLINRTSKAISRLNRMANYSPKIGRSFFDWQAQELTTRMAEKPELVKYPDLDPNVDLPDAFLNRLKEGYSVEQCVDMDMRRSAAMPTDASSDAGFRNQSTASQTAGTLDDTSDAKYEEILENMRKQYQP